MIQSGRALGYRCCSSMIFFRTSPHLFSEGRPLRASCVLGLVLTCVDEAASWGALVLPKKGDDNNATKVQVAGMTEDEAVDNGGADADKEPMSLL